MKLKYCILGVLFMVSALLLEAESVLATQTTILPNGMTVLVEEDRRFPLVSIRLYVRAGSAYETPKQAGISHLLEHMVFKGTAKRGPGQIAAEIEGAGGSLNAATSFDYTMYMMDLPSKQWALGLDAFQDMIFGASIDAEELASEKKVVISELERGQDNPGQLLFQDLQKKIWQAQSYGRPIIGFRETVNSFSRQDILDYIHEYYQPQSMVLVVCGNVKNDEVVPEVTRLFGDLRNNRDINPALPFDPLPIKSDVRLQKGAWNKIYLAAAMPIPGFHSPQATAMEVLAHLLSGDTTSRLYRKFKYELQLVDDISVSPMMLERGGMFYIHATLDEDKLDQFWPKLWEEMAELKADDFSQEEIKRTRINLEDSLFQAKETLSGLASKLGYFQFFEGSLEAENLYLAQLRHIDKQQLQEVIDNWLYPQQVVVSVVAPQEADISTKELQAVIGQKWKKKSPVSLALETKEMGEKPEIIDLGAGCQLVMQPDPTLPYTSITMAWPGGDRLVKESQQGLSELVSRVLTRGTEKMNYHSLQAFLADRAAIIDAGSGREHFYVSAKYPVRFDLDVIGLLQDVLLHPAFASDEILRAKENQIADIKQQQDQPMGLLFSNILPFLFTSHPYSYLHSGTEQGVRNLSAGDVHTFWEKQRRQPFVLSVCGQMDCKQIRAVATKLASKVNQSLQAVPSIGWGQSKEKILNLKERNQSHLLMIFPVAGMHNPDSAGLNLLKTALSGQSGLLFNELREKQGLGYTVTAMLWQVGEAGFLAFYIGTSPDKEKQALQGFKQMAQSLRQNPVPEDILERAKNLMSGGYYREHQSLASRSREAASLLVRGFELDYQQKLIAKAQKLTAKDIQDLASKYLLPEQAYLMKIEP